jgi:hypothetical protein
VEIATLDDLQKIGMIPAYPANGHYTLTQNIDAAATADWNDGKGFQPLPAFSGLFDGQGHFIRGLHIHRSEEWNVGLFESISASGVVQNVGLLDCAVEGFIDVGALAGSMAGRISGCRVSADVTGFLFTGGIAGSATGTFERCSVTGSVEGAILIGGIAGEFAASGIIRDSCVQAAVTGLISVGGITGAADDAVSLLRCYAAGPVTAWTPTAGGLVPAVVELSAMFKDGDKAPSVESSFWDFETTGQAASFGGEAKTTAELRHRDLFSSAGWDLTTVWAITGEVTYPYLRGVDPGFGSPLCALNTAVEGAGSVTVTSPFSTPYPAQAHVVLSATPEAGMRFLAWTGTGLPDIGLPQNPIRLVMSSARVITARFAPEFIEIGSIEDLQRIGQDPAYPVRGAYRLTGDIDAAATADWNDGKGFSPILGPRLGGFENLDFGGLNVCLHYPFLGTFDGAGYAISGLSIDRAQSPMKGLFSIVARGARIHDLTLDEFFVRAATHSGGLAGMNAGQLSDINVAGTLVVTPGTMTLVLGSFPSPYPPPEPSNPNGALAGLNYGAIDRCSATAHLSGALSWAGGLVGHNECGTIDRCRAQCTFSGGTFLGGLVARNGGQITRSYAGGILEDGKTMGGLVGYNVGMIANAYATTQLRGAGVVGGLAGENNGQIQNCYAAGPLTGHGPNPTLGGLVGMPGATDENGVTASFWDVAATGQVQSASPPETVGAGLTTSALCQAATFTGVGWDFNSVWTIDEGFSYPYLQDMGPAAEERFTLTIATEGPGVIEVSPLQDSYPPHTLVILTPRPDAGCKFFSWSGQDVHSAGQRRALLLITMDRDWSLEAQFISPPHVIASAADLQRIGNDPEWPLYGDYVLTDNLDVSETANWNAGAGFIPIGTEASPFIGSLDGGGYAVTGLTVVSSQSIQGLFAAIGEEGTVSNLILQDISINGKNGVGGVAGVHHGRLASCAVSGTVYGRARVGALVGTNYGNIEQCSTNATVTESSDTVGWWVGGITGRNEGILSLCYSTAIVTGTFYTGGVAGANAGELYGCCSAAVVTGVSYVGGITGQTEGDLAWCGSSATVTGTEMTGGVTGYNYGTIERCLAGGTVTAVGSESDIGGIAGGHWTGTISECASTANVYAPTSYSVGGLAGRVTDAHVLRSYASGFTKGKARVGGLVGYLCSNVSSPSTPWIDQCYAAGPVVGVSGKGGLVGTRQSTSLEASASFWDTQATGQAASAMGTGLTTDTMKQAAAFLEAGWDFEMVWGIDEGQGYPYLPVLAGLDCPEASVEGEGLPEAETEGQTSEGEVEGGADGENEGQTPEAETEAESEGTAEGFVPPEHPHAADQNGDGQINLTELLRVIQFYNSGGYHCPEVEQITEDGYVPGPGTDQSCAPHASDYAPQDWLIQLTELLRLIQFFNMGGYLECPGQSTEDGFCPYSA